MSNLPQHSAPQYTEEDLALRFSDDHAHDLRYTALWSSWSHWDGMRWKREETLLVFDLVRKFCRRESRIALQDPKTKGFAKQIVSPATVAAIERLARCDRTHAMRVEDWDRDLMILNTPGGTIDLRTGAKRDANHLEGCTKITAVTPGGQCPLWRKFLEKITNGDAALQEYLQRLCGYALTGDTREQAFFFLYGTGANGKSVFLSTVLGIIGEYGRTAAMETFTALANDAHTTDLAGLQGARFVSASETEEGKRWNESKIKRMTGCDPISARFMRQDFFDYLPQFKIFIAGNQKPGLSIVDEAIRRRLHLIPFTVTIPPEERDKELFNKLRPEWPGILQWMVDGCVAWQEAGLKLPPIIIEATVNYLDEEDVLAQWTEECCTIEPQNLTPVAQLFSSYKEWCARNDEAPDSKKKFSQKLESRGYQRERKAKERVFKKLGLRSTPIIPEESTESVSSGAIN